MPQPNVKAEGKVQKAAPGPGQAVDEGFQRTAPLFQLEDEEPPEPGQGLEIPEGEVVEEPAPEGQAALQALLKKKGLKSADDLVKSYENLERQFQEKSRVAAKAAAIPPPLPDFNAVAEGIRQKTRRPVPELKVPEDPLELFKDKTGFVNFLDTYQKAVEARTTNAVEVQQELERAQQLYVESRQIAEEFPEDFQRLRPVMADLVNYYPNASPRQLFEIAKSQAERQKQEAMDIVRRELGLDGVDLGRLKSIVGRANPVPLAEGGAPPIGSTEGMTERQIREDRIKKAILASDQLY